MRHFHVLTKSLSAAASLVVVAGCGDTREPGDAQFLTRRVEALEEKVKDLESRVRAAPQSAGDGDQVETNSPLAPAPAAGLPLLTGATPEERLENEEKRTLVFLAKVERLQRASRSELPGVIADLGIPAPELDQHRTELQRLQAQKAGQDGNAELNEQIDKVKFLLEIAAEGVRSRVVDEGKQLAARVDSLRNQVGGAPGGAASGPPDTP